MKIIKLFLSPVVLMLFCQQISAQQTVTIKGTVKGDTKGRDNIYVYGQGIKSDTAKIINGQFEFNLSFKEPFVPMFYTEYEVRNNGGFRPLPVIVQQAGVIYIKDIDITRGLRTGTISGMNSAVDFQNFSKLKGSMSELIEFVRTHPDSYVSAYLLNSRKTSMSQEDLKNTYQLLGKNIRATNLGSQISEYMEGLKNSATGEVVKDFILNTPEDEAFAFSNLKGKYVVLDFWASWCGPCKESFPHMKKIYEKYKGDKFEMYSISVDQSKAAWLAELKKINLPWIQTLDNKSIARGKFAVSAVPTVYLIDPDGKILIKELGFKNDGSSPIEQKLREVFDKL